MVVGTGGAWCDAATTSSTASEQQRLLGEWCVRLLRVQQWPGLAALLLHLFEAEFNVAHSVIPWQDPLPLIAISDVLCVDLGCVAATTVHKSAPGWCCEGVTCGRRNRRPHTAVHRDVRLNVTRTGCQWVLSGGVAHAHNLLCLRLQ
jgi:hypothetical protein